MNTRVVLGFTAAAGAVVLLGQVNVGAEGDLVTAPHAHKHDGAPVAAGNSIGPDVVASRVGLFSSGNGNNLQYLGQFGGISAYSMASTSCNVGSENAQWMSGSAGNHPVIAQNAYRMYDGKFEQIGQSWLKHSFAALDETTCGPCNGGGVPSSFLAVDCADTYGAGLNDGQGGGPKFLINPQGQGSGGTHSGHNWAAPTGNNAIRGRLQIHHTEMSIDSRYAVEIQYVTHDEPLGNRHNNASWREATITATSITSGNGGQAEVHRGEAGIYAWQAWDPTVKINPVDVPGEGRFLIGYKITDNGDGTWDYEYAVHNLNSDRAGQSFSVPMGNNVIISNVGFHDVDYHSGEPFDGTDWGATVGSTSVSWATESFATSTNANALRWGTLYNFRFRANAAPVPGAITLGLFKPGTPTSVDSAIPVPGNGPMDESCAADIDGPGGEPDGNVDAIDFLTMIGQWGSPCVVGGCEADITGPTPGVPDGNVDSLDQLLLIAQWGSPANCP